MAVALDEITVIHGGLQDYLASLAIQREIHQKVAEGSLSNTLILVEHPSVYTAGRRTDELERPLDGTPVIDVDRGGKITWHGPGQIVGYPIVRLEKRNEVVGFVRTLEGALIKTLADFGIHGEQIADKTGVWIKDQSGERKIAAIGVRVAKGVTMHGFALNVAPDLAHFTKIIPCGLPDSETTSMARELHRNLDRNLDMNLDSNLDSNLDKAITIGEVTPILQRHMIEALSTVSKIAP